jgi:hypothetical protein
MEKPAEVMNAIEKKVNSIICKFRLPLTVSMAKDVRSANPPVISQ